MSYLRYFSLLAHSGVQHILCCVFLFCVPYVASFSGCDVISLVHLYMSSIYITMFVMLFH
jgi:hypothetical protein